MNNTEKIVQILEESSDDIRTDGHHEYVGIYSEKYKDIAETIVENLIIPIVSISFIDQIKKQIEYHQEQETNRSKMKDYSQAIYHDNRRGALQDLLVWIKLNEC